MNRKNELPAGKEEQLSNGEYSVRRNRRTDVIAFVLCLLLAIFAWLVRMNTTETLRLPLEIQGDTEYELSDTDIEVTGKVSDLKRAKCVKVNVPDGAVCEMLTEKDFDLPEGVRLSGNAGPVYVVKK